MPLDLFHPLVRQWFTDKFGSPTPPQQFGWPAIAAGQDTLIAAPTGSGKTLAAFLVCLDRLVKQWLAGTLEDRTYVVYISPLKALSNDIQRNLQVPLAELSERAVAALHGELPIRAAVRTGDTAAKDRQAMLRHPPHIMVTTPESLYLLLTSEGGRRMLRGVETVIVDEIHALARDKRGSHLALSLERLDALCEKRPTRIGLSATQRPIERIASFLVGTDHIAADGKPICQIVDAGHVREVNLGIEVPPSELSAVCANEQWEEIYARIVELINQHRSTLIFVNTRRMAERIAHNLRQALGEESVASHHGSLAKELRLDAEQRLKEGKLKAIVATASLEMGIDIGYIDLVIQIGSPRSIATFLQRVGRSGHALGLVPKGRLFPLTRDELIESLALIRAVYQKRLDTVEVPVAPLDILSQQIVASCACEEWGEDELFHMLRGAWCYRDLSRETFNRIIKFLSEGVTPKLHKGNHLHRDAIGHRLKARRGAKLAAATSGGAIPEKGEYRVVIEPERTLVGTVDEDFAIDSSAGDIFLLGNTSWRICYVRGGEVVVQDAHGAPPSIPFWFGEAPGRTIELSHEISRLREEIAHEPDDATAIAWLLSDCGATQLAAVQAVNYVRAQFAAMGLVPTNKQIVFERFFDESGGMQLVVHAPLGSRINRAWGLAMRKRFCRSFDFELQASADDDGFVLSIGPQHSFPVEQLFGMLTAQNARELLEQALLVSPMFQVRWRWNVTRALVVLRSQGGKKVPPFLQKFRAEDVLAAVFPETVGCLENHHGDVVIPDHPLVQQTMHDCLTEAMDIDRWIGVLEQVRTGEIQLIARDTREPSPFAMELINAAPYAFLDGAPLEERRTRAVSQRRSFSTEEMRDLGRLDDEAISLVRSQAWPVVRDTDELHDALLSMAALPVEDAAPWADWLLQLAAKGRAALAKLPTGHAWWVAAERWPLLRAAHPQATLEPKLNLPAELDVHVEASQAWVELLRGQIQHAGPVTSADLAERLQLQESQASAALEALEGDGSVMRGRFTTAAYDARPRDGAVKIAARDKPDLCGPDRQGEQCGTGKQRLPVQAPEHADMCDTGKQRLPVLESERTQSLEHGQTALARATQPDEQGQTALARAITIDSEPSPIEWCDRRLLARIHRLTLDGLRRRIQPVDPSQYLRFLAHHHRLLPGQQTGGPAAVREAILQLQGLQIPAGAWESRVLAPRCAEYDAGWLDQLFLSGELVWGRLCPPQRDEADGPSLGALTRTVPITLALREDLPWLLPLDRSEAQAMRGGAEQVLETLQARGALFLPELTRLTQMLPTHLEEALRELAALGLVTSDAFAAVRSIAGKQAGRDGRLRKRVRGNGSGTLAPAGRWSPFPGFVEPAAKDKYLEQWCQLLLRRWGVVFRDVLAREAAAPAWHQLVPVFRRLERRGELRGGRFVSGVAGEQFALESTVMKLRDVREASTADSPWIIVSAADPLNLYGIITPGERIPAIHAHWMILRDGKLIAARQAGAPVFFEELSAELKHEMTRAMAMGKRPPPQRLQVRTPEDRVARPAIPFSRHGSSIISRPHG